MSIKVVKAMLGDNRFCAFWCILMLKECLAGSLIWWRLMENKGGSVSGHESWPDFALGMHRS